MPADNPELHAAPPPAAAKKRGMQRLLKSAFRRADSSVAGAREEEAAGGRLSRSSSASGSSGGRGRRWRRGVGVGDGDLSGGESAELDGSKNAKAITALSNAKIGHAYESFPWEKKMRELLPVPEASSFLSLLLLPKATDVSNSKYNSLEDTLARADAWLLSSRSSGVPLVFMNVQTEALLTKISGDTALSTVNMGSLSDLANMANVSLYGFEDYHGVDIGVVRAVRLWYTAIAGEMTLEIKLQQGDTRLGFSISRTEEGFIYVSSVADESTPGVASTRSGLLELYREARKASKLLVISRVGHHKVLPWMVSTAGDIKCFDTVSLSQKLSLHRHALQPITLHFLMWEELSLTAIIENTEAHKPVPVLALPPLHSAAETADEGDGPEIKFGKDSGDSSFRFQNIDLPASWL